MLSTYEQWKPIPTVVLRYISALEEQMITNEHPCRIRNEKKKNSESNMN